MKKLLKVSMIAVLLVIGLSAVQAQRGGGFRNMSPEDRAAKQTEHMTESLSLSEKQAEKVGEINLKYAQKMKDARAAKEEGDRTAMRETMQQIRSEQDAELQTVLTSEQFEQLQKNREEMQKQRGEKRGERRGQKRQPKMEEGEKG